jgi:hypothetical protein
MLVGGSSGNDCRRLERVRDGKLLRRVDTRQMI